VAVTQARHTTSPVTSNTGSVENELCVSEYDMIIMYYTPKSKLFYRFDYCAKYYQASEDQVFSFFFFF
jgi:hypothetical protein